jgi:hypothetical protein
VKKHDSTVVVTTTLIPCKINANSPIGHLQQLHFSHKSHAFIAQGGFITSSTAIHHKRSALQ